MDRVVLRDMLTKILTDVPLSDREQLVVGLYVIEDYTLKEIGKQLAVSKERVNQIYKRAMRKLRSHQQSLTGIKVLSQDCEVMTWQRWKIYKQ